jgi:hypothetical protein
MKIGSYDVMFRRKIGTSLSETQQDIELSNGLNFITKKDLIHASIVMVKHLGKLG